MFTASGHGNVLLPAWIWDYVAGVRNLLTCIAGNRFTFGALTRFISLLLFTLVHFKSLHFLFGMEML